MHIIFGSILNPLSDLLSIDQKDFNFVCNSNMQFNTNIYTINFK